MGGTLIGHIGACQPEGITTPARAGPPSSTVAPHATIGILHHRPRTYDGSVTEDTVADHAPGPMLTPSRPTRTGQPAPWPPRRRPRPRQTGLWNGAPCRALRTSCGRRPRQGPAQKRRGSPAGTCPAPDIRTSSRRTGQEPIQRAARVKQAREQVVLVLVGHAVPGCAPPHRAT